MSFSFREYKRVMPRVAAVHDLCGYGNCSLGVALPVLSAGGIDACAVPTAYLSAHTAFPSYRFFDTTENLESYLNHWQAIDIHLDGIYTGFLGSAQQIDIITDFAAHHPEACIVVDPVMADHGKIYKTYTPEMCRKMKDLAVISHVLTPNLTEAAVLLDEEYEGQAISLARAQELCEKLLELGPEQVVLKGILQGEDKIINMVADKKSNRFETTVHVLRHHALHGTGDLFASTICAALFNDIPLLDAVQFTGELVCQAIDISTWQPGFEDRGVSYEPLLGDIADFCLGSK